MNAVPRRHSFQWHITHRCNLRCAHCYQDDYESEPSLDDLIEILDKYERFLNRSGALGHIFLTGGEPLYHEGFFPLIREISSRGIRLSILTNGTLIGRKEANAIACAFPDFVQISLDGTPEIHDRIRGKGQFTRALEGIDRLKEQGVCVLVSFTAQKENFRCLPQLAKICAAHGVDKLWWDRVVTETPEDAERLALTTDMFARLVADAHKLNRKYARRQRLFVSSERSLQFLGARDECRVYRCRVGGDLIVILADGSVMPCRRLPFVIGNIKDGEFDDIIGKSDLMREMREAPLPDGCSGCPHAEKCGGGAKCVTYGQTGDLFARDVNCFFTF